MGTAYLFRYYEVLVTVNSVGFPRIFIGPQEISGYYQNLELGFSQIGVSARLVTTHPHPFGYGQLQPNPWPARMATEAVLRHRSARLLNKQVWALTYLLSSLLLTFWALFRFEVFIFAWGTSLLPLNIDIPLLRLFGKKVFVVLGHGSEARPPYMSTPPHDGYPSSKHELQKLQAQVSATAASVRRNERFASQIIGMQMTAHFLTREYIDFYRIGVPTLVMDTATLANSNFSPIEKTPFTVLHVPSNKAVKGTDQIRAVMDGITKRHENVVYKEVSGVAHDMILSEIREADLVIDQLWSDIPMAVVGAEAASLGKATVISSYGWPQWDRWEKLNGKTSVPPTMRATPENLAEVLDNALANREAIAALGQRARHFVENVWSPVQVAKNYLRIISDDYPETWVQQPSQVDYLWGVGVSRANVLTMVEALVSTAKPDVLRWPRGEQLYQDYLSGKRVG